MMEYECKIYNNVVYGEVVRDVVLMPVINREKNVCYRCVIPAVCLDRRVYRLKSARGVWNIRRPEIYNGLGKYEIWKTGTIYPRCTDSYHKVFCALYNMDRRDN